MTPGVLPTSCLYMLPLLVIRHSQYPKNNITCQPTEEFYYSEGVTLRRTIECVGVRFVSSGNSVSMFEKLFIIQAWLSWGRYGQKGKWWLPGHTALTKNSLIHKWEWQCCKMTQSISLSPHTERICKCDGARWHTRVGYANLFFRRTEYDSH